MACNREGAMKGAATRIGITLKEYKAKLDAGQKWCSGCQEWHPRENFAETKARGDGLSPTCRSWHKAKNAAKAAS